MKSQVKNWQAGATSSSRTSAKSKTIILSILATTILLAAVFGIVLNLYAKVSPHEAASHTFTIIRSACSSTRFPDLCFDAVKEVNVTSQKEVIEASLNITIDTVRRNYFTIRKLTTLTNLTPRGKTALHDCLETIDSTLDELHEAYADLELYPTKKSISKHAEDLKTLLSAAMTNQDTCLDGFSHDGADKKVRKVLEAGEKHVEKMCSNVLAMISNLTGTDIAAAGARASAFPTSTHGGRRLLEWPEWMSAGDRKLMQSGTVKPDAVVAADGSGDYKTVSAAVAGAPSKGKSRYVIRIKSGVYTENVDVPKSKTNIMFLGDGRTTTIITGRRNVVDGSTTFHSATVAAVGANFLARDITFENTAGPSKHQAVALRVGSDLSAFYRCDILAYQDTLYVHSNRQFYYDCFIAGTVDFIFGNAAAFLQNCDIHARKPNSGQKNMVTAQGRSDPNQNTGIVIQKSRIGATSDLKPVQKNFPTYLGRPWKEYSRTVIMQTSITDVIHPVGWHEWEGSFALSTLYYGEYKNTGLGAATGGRVSWKGYKVINSATEAQMFTPENFVGGNSWLSSTGFPFSLGL
ncbi:hypothetical protein QQ045_025829 [Rhodiola kirilowii]